MFRWRTSWKEQLRRNGIFSKTRACAQLVPKNGIASDSDSYWDLYSPEQSTQLWLLSWWRTIMSLLGCQNMAKPDTVCQQSNTDKRPTLLRKILHPPYSKIMSACHSLRFCVLETITGSPAWSSPKGKCWYWEEPPIPILLFLQKKMEIKSGQTTNEFWSSCKRILAIWDSGLHRQSYKFWEHKF